jgi:5-aminolevulinate synthase
MTSQIDQGQAMALPASYRQGVDALRADGLYREFVPCSYLADEPGYALHQGRRIEVWCSNDYLGLSHHPEVIGAQVEAALRHGTGSGGSRNIAGTSVAHVALEESLADWHGKERALVLTSGYVANFETLSTLFVAEPGMVVFSDALNHRSLIEGIVRSPVRKHVFAHNDVAELERLLQRYDLDQPKLIVFESLYSMDGDHGPITEFCDLAERYNALTYLDETHAIGMAGPTGAGLCEELGEHRPTFIQGVFGKALGTVGGYVAGPDAALDYVRSHAPGFIFTTTIPAASLEATRQSLSIVRSEPGRELRELAWSNAALMKEELGAAGISFISAPSHLVPVLVPGANRVKQISRRLLGEYGIYVQPINFPSVPRGVERFRITVPPARTRKQITGFVSALHQCLSEA